MNTKLHSPKRNINILLITFLGTVAVVGTVLGILLFQLYSNSKAPAVLSSSPTTSPIETILPPVSTITQTPSITFTSGITPTSGTGGYTVQAGDTLSGIAVKFGVSVEAIKQANSLTSDLIYPGDQLIIPTSPLSPASTKISGKYSVSAGDTIDSIAAAHNISSGDLRAANFMYGDALLPNQVISIPDTTPVPLSPYRFSILQGDISDEYPLSLNSGRFTMHYTANTFPAQDPQIVYAMIERSVADIESLFQIQLSGTFDVYVAGTLFESPNSQLRGISYSIYRRSFFLHDGTGDTIDQQYISAHELTHLFTWNTFGQPASTMLSEGAAVYSGMSAISASDYIPLSTFCAAYKQQGKLPKVSGQLSFTGHIYDLENYYASGCFVGYLIKTYGVQALGLVYHDGNFPEVYGRSIDQLENDWIASIDDTSLPDGFDAARLIGAVNTIENRYRSFMPGFSGNPNQLQAYRELDLARLSLLRGKFDEMDSYLRNIH